MKPLSSVIKAGTKSLLEQRYSMREVQKKLGISHGLIISIRNECDSLPPIKTGRKKLLSDRDARNLAQLVITGKTPKKATREIRKPISGWTAQRALKDIDLKAKEKKKKPAL